VNTTRDFSSGAPKPEILNPKVEQSARPHSKRQATRLAIVVLTVATIVATGLFGAGAAGFGPAKSLFSQPVDELLVPSTITTHGLVTWPSVELVRISCPISGPCVALGDRQNGQISQAIFVVQQGRSWSAPVPFGPWVVGTQWTNASLSCSSRRLCIVGGVPDPLPVYAISPSQERWIGGHSVPLSSDIPLRVSTEACSSAGSCWAILPQSANGVDGGHIWDYAVRDSGGQWSQPYRVGGAKLLVSGRPPLILSSSISCWSSSSCSVAVFAPNAPHLPSIFTQSETNGTWGTDSQAPSSTPHGKVGFEFTGDLGGPFACTSAGTCLIGGFLGTETSNPIGAVEQEVNGKWLPLIGDIGTSLKYPYSRVLTVACHAAALCVAAGESSSHSGTWVPFTQAEVRGHWTKPVFLKLPVANSALVLITGQSCPMASTCSLVGEVMSRNYTHHSFVVTYVRSRWHYSLASFNGETSNLGLMNLSCTGTICWVSGTFYNQNGAPTGVVFRFVAGQAVR
jgi:hypothetical protein